MNKAESSSLEHPVYVQGFHVRGAFWRRFWLNLLFRLVAKGRLGAQPNILRIRQRLDRLDQRLSPADTQINRCPVLASDFSAEWLESADARPERVILYLHGGAFVFRTPGIHARLVGSWCKSLKARALMVDYRLAPEHPWPAAIDDAHAAYRWLLANGNDAQNIVLAGDSAGGNLALALLHRIKAAGEPMPACSALLSPFVDFTLSSLSLCTNERRDPIFSANNLVALRRHYAKPEQFLDPSLSPLFGDYHGFPPLLYQASDSEMLRDESLRSAERAHAAGVDVRVELWKGGLPHVFQALHTLPQAQAAVQRILKFIRHNTAWAD